jgi:hypothetical protein
MRNILSHPITKEEVVSYLRGYLNQERERIMSLKPEDVPIGDLSLEYVIAAMIAVKESNRSVYTLADLVIGDDR